MPAPEQKDIDPLGVTDGVEGVEFTVTEVTADVVEQLDLVAVTV